MPLSDWLSGVIGGNGVALLPLSVDISIDANALPGAFHDDPADRIIVATARKYNLQLQAPLYRRRRPAGDVFSATMLGDLDKDGRIDVVVGRSRWGKGPTHLYRSRFGHRVRRRRRCSRRREHGRVYIEPWMPPRYRPCPGNEAGSHHHSAYRRPPPRDHGYERLEKDGFGLKCRVSPDDACADALSLSLKTYMYARETSRSAKQNSDRTLHCACCRSVSTFRSIDLSETVACAATAGGVFDDDAAVKQYANIAQRRVF